jgi:branched-chain amino acid transport system ATP-binding protein
VASTLPIIERLNGEGLAIIMVEHRLKELFRIAHRVIALNFGSKIADGSAREVMENDAVKSAYLGSEEEEKEDA